MLPRHPARRVASGPIAVLIGCLMLLVCGGAARAQDGSLEYAVKATYLYKFAPFIEWPGTAFETRSSPLILCVVGEDPFGPVLERAVAGQRVGERSIVIRRLAALEGTSGCHIMYVMGSDTQPVAAALDRVRGMPVLTVTDAARGAAAKGIVHFVIRDGRVRFEIDDRTAAESGIRISSKVLSLATSVRPRS